MDIIFTYDELEEAAERFLNKTSGHKVFAFTGELGAGKTTFIGALCKQLGVAETVTSPTYSIIQEYHTDIDRIIYHLDLYRLKDLDEATEAGVEDCVNSGQFCLVEWPEKVPDIFPEETVYTNFEILPSGQRKMIIHLP